MALINEPEDQMDLDTLKAALKRLANELPTIAAGVAAVLYVVGLELDLDGIVERAEGIVAFVLWLLARQSVDGPVTLSAKRQHRKLLEDVGTVEVLDHAEDGQ